MGAVGIKIASQATGINSVEENKKLEENLTATAVAMSRNGELTSFKPKGEFTQKFFDEVSGGTFVIKVRSDNGGKGSTAWCAGKYGNNVYMVTSLHELTLDGGGPIQSIEMWRPNIDKKKVSLVNYKIAKSNEEIDQAVIKCELSPEESLGISPLRYIDGADLTSNQEVLVVGFPKEFKQETPDGLGFFTSGQIGVNVMKTDSLKRVWTVLGLVDFGGSGSPAVVPDEHGNPIVAGTTNLKVVHVELDKWLKINRIPAISGTTLEVGKLIAAVDKL